MGVVNVKVGVAFNFLRVLLHQNPPLHNPRSATAAGKRTIMRNRYDRHTYNYIWIAHGMNNFTVASIMVIDPGFLQQGQRYGPITRYRSSLGVHEYVVSFHRSTILFSSDSTTAAGFLWWPWRSRYVPVLSRIA